VAGAREDLERRKGAPGLMLYTAVRRSPPKVSLRRLANRTVWGRPVRGRQG
jgi:hypothetical protein